MLCERKKYIYVTLQLLTIDFISDNIFHLIEAIMFKQLTVYIATNISSAVIFALTKKNETKK